MISPFTLITTSLFIFFSVLICALLFFRHQRILIYSVFSLTSVASLLALIAGIWTVRYEITESWIILMGLPDLPFHLRLDPLSGFFLTLIRALGFIVSVYSIGYVKGFIGQRPVTSLAIFYSLFLAGMFMVVLAAGGHLGRAFQCVCPNERDYSEDRHIRDSPGPLCPDKGFPMVVGGSGIDT